MENATIAAARRIYEQLQADTLAATPLGLMSDWVTSGRAPSALTLRSAGFRSEGDDNAGHLRLARKAFVRGWGFSIPCQEAVEALVRLSPIVEIGAGSGYWTALLRGAGAEIVATDIQTSGPSAHYGFMSAKHAESLDLDAVSAVRHYPTRNVLCSWPAQDTPWDAEAALAMEPGRVFALIGTPRGGLTGTPALFDALDGHFEQIVEVVIPQFPDVGDSLTLYRRLDV